MDNYTMIRFANRLKRYLDNEIKIRRTCIPTSDYNDGLITGYALTKSYIDEILEKYKNGKGD